VRFLLLLILAGCATQPTHVPHATWRTKLVWHEIEDKNIHLVCRQVLNENGRSRSVAFGCYKWQADELHIYTRVVRNEYHLCDAGHEVFHGKAGTFHDRDGNWTIAR
jgi:hypothetical protein